MSATNVAAIIRQSISENRTVTVDFDRAACREIERLADGINDEDDGSLDCYGTTAGGGEWRIRIRDGAGWECRDMSGAVSK